jgi:hypothetical protein
VNLRTILIVDEKLKEEFAYQKELIIGSTWNVIVPSNALKDV